MDCTFWWWFNWTSSIRLKSLLITAVCIGLLLTAGEFTYMVWGEVDPKTSLLFEALFAVDNVVFDYKLGLLFSHETLDALIIILSLKVGILAFRSGKSSQAILFS